MHESQDIETLLPEVDTKNHLSLINKSALQHLKVSYQSSNLTSNILLKDVWNSNKKLFNDKAMDLIINSSKDLLKNCDSHAETWRSSLHKFTDPETLFENSLPTCKACINSSPYEGLDNFNRQECKCDLGIKTVCKTNKETVVSHNKADITKYSEYPKPISVNSSQSSREEMKYDDCDKFRSKFKHRANRNFETKPQDYKVENSLNTRPTVASSHDPASPVTYDLSKEEEENKAHKSNVAKIMFKTAKEQLLASNPAAKRTLGASRKAQGKFVSPMIGAQEKEQTSEPMILDEKLKHLDPKMVELIESEIIDNGTPIAWEDIAGLSLAKSVIQEAVVWPLLRPDIFTGLRRPPKGILLFGPPGTGKTLIGKCVAAQCHATFFSISASSLTSKWIGDGEKMVRALFAVARSRQPAVIFIDEIDSLLTQRSDGEHEATRRIKTEFLVQFDGAATADEDRLLIVGATNRPQELDEAARRRLVKRLYIPLPDTQARNQIISNLLQSENNDLSSEEIAEMATLTEGYSGADMKSLCSEAAMGPIRAVPLSQIATIHRDSVRPVCAQDFIAALQRVRPSVSQDDLGQYVKWNQTYGQGF